MFLEGAFEHIDRRVERRAHRTELGLAVPPAVVESFVEYPLDDRRDVDPDVGAGLDRAPVDAGLELTVEVPLAVVLPPSVLRDEGDRASGRLRARIEAQQLQGLESVHRRRPRLTRLAATVRGGKARAAGPQTVGIRRGQQPCTPTLVLDLRSLGGELGGGCVEQIAHDLPADRRVAVQQPVDHATVDVDRPRHGEV